MKGRECSQITCLYEGFWTSPRIKHYVLPVSATNLGSVMFHLYLPLFCESDNPAQPGAVSSRTTNMKLCS